MVQHALQLGQQVTAQLGCSHRVVSGVALCAQGLPPHILQQPNAPQNALLAQTFPVDCYNLSSNTRVSYGQLNRDREYAEQADALSKQ